VCTQKTDCPTSSEHTYEKTVIPVGMGGNVQDKDNTWCKPYCTAGQAYVQSEVAFPMLADGCGPCPIDLYQESQSHHNVCEQCPSGKFTVGEGTRFRSGCTTPNVRTLRTTHRLWYFFGAAMKETIACVWTTITPSDLSGTMGAKAARNPLLSPMCKENYGGNSLGEVTAYVERKQAVNSNWDSYPLDISHGSFLVIDALAGQQIDALFRGVSKSTGKDAQPLREHSAAVCGCIDYTAVLPSVCTGSVVLTFSDAYGVEDVHLPDGTEARYRTDAASADVTGGKIYVSGVPVGAFDCRKHKRWENNGGHWRGDREWSAYAISAYTNDPVGCASSCADDADCKAYTHVDGTNSNFPMPVGSCYWFNPSSYNTAPGAAVDGAAEFKEDFRGDEVICAKRVSRPTPPHQRWRNGCYHGGSRHVVDEHKLHLLTHGGVRACVRESPLVCC